MSKANRIYHRKIRDTESNLPAVRVARGLSVVELLDTAKINVNDYLQLSTGEQSPLYVNDRRGIAKAGDVKPAVKRIMKVLKCDFSDLFPRYACKIPAKFITNEQILDCTISDYSKTGQTINGGLDRVLSLLSEKHRFVIEETIIDGNTLQSVADALHLTKERIRQIQAKALRVLRHPSHKNVLAKIIEKGEQ